MLALFLRIMCISIKEFLAQLALGLYHKYLACLMATFDPNYTIIQVVYFLGIIVGRIQA